MKPDLASFKEFEYRDLSIRVNTGILFNWKLDFASFTISQVSKCIISVSSFLYIYVLYGNIENGGWHCGHCGPWKICTDTRSVIQCLYIDEKDKPNQKKQNEPLINHSHNFMKMY